MTVGGTGAGPNVVAVDMRLIDHITAELRTIEAALRRVGTGQSQKGIKETGSNATAAAVASAGLGRNLRLAGTALSGLTGIAGGFTAVGLAFALREAAAAGGDLSLALAEVLTIADPLQFTSESITRITRELAGEFSVSQSQVARGLYQTISAGATEAEAATSILREGIRLQRAGIAELVPTIDALTNIVNAYALEGTEAARISDILFESVKRGKTRVEELAVALGPVLPIAAGLGVEFEEVSAAIVELTKQGFSTSEAVTALRRLLIELSRKASEVDEKFRRVGLSFKASDIATRSLVDILRELEQATGGNADVLNDLFGRIEAINGALALSKNNGEDFRRTLEALHASAGATGEAFEVIQSSSGQRLRNFFVDLRNTAAQTSEVMLDSAFAVKDAYSALADEVGEAVGLIDENTGTVAGNLERLNDLIASLGRGDSLKDQLLEAASAAGFTAEQIKDLRAEIDRTLKGGAGIEGFESLFDRLQELRGVQLFEGATSNLRQIARDLEQVEGVIVRTARILGEGGGQALSIGVNLDEDANEFLQLISGGAAGGEEFDLDVALAPNVQFGADQVNDLQRAIAAALLEAQRVVAERAAQGVRDVTFSDFQSAFVDALNNAISGAPIEGVAQDGSRALISAFEGSLKDGRLTVVPEFIQSLPRQAEDAGEDAADAFVRGIESAIASRPGGGLTVPVIGFETEGVDIDEIPALRFRDTGAGAEDIAALEEGRITLEEFESIQRRVIANGNEIVSVQLKIAEAGKGEIQTAEFRLTAEEALHRLREDGKTQVQAAQIVEEAIVRSVNARNEAAIDVIDARRREIALLSALGTEEERQRAAAEQEAAFRELALAKLVQKGKVTVEQANKEIALIRLLRAQTLAKIDDEIQAERDAAAEKERLDSERFREDQTAALTASIVRQRELEESLLPVREQRIAAIHREFDGQLAGLDAVESKLKRQGELAQDAVDAFEAERRAIELARDAAIELNNIEERRRVRRITGDVGELEGEFRRARSAGGDPSDFEGQADRARDLIRRLQELDEVDAGVRQRQIDRLSALITAVNEEAAAATARVENQQALERELEISEEISTSVFQRAKLEAELLPEAQERVALIELEVERQKEILEATRARLDREGKLTAELAAAFDLEESALDRILAKRLEIEASERRVREEQERRRALQEGELGFFESFTGGFGEAVDNFETFGDLGRELGEELAGIGRGFARELASGGDDFDEFKDRVIEGLLAMAAEFAILNALKAVFTGEAGAFGSLFSGGGEDAAADTKEAADATGNAAGETSAAAGETEKAAGSMGGAAGSLLGAATGVSSSTAGLVIGGSLLLAASAPLEAAAATLAAGASTLLAAATILAASGGTPGLAKGGVTGRMLGHVPVRAYRAGGIADDPQFAIFGEDGAEAFVPLPDGRTIPVTIMLSGGARERGGGGDMVTALEALGASLSVSLADVARESHRAADAQEAATLALLASIESRVEAAARIRGVQGFGVGAGGAAQDPFGRSSGTTVTIEMPVSVEVGLETNVDAKGSSSPEDIERAVDRGIARNAGRIRRDVALAMEKGLGDGGRMLVNAARAATGAGGSRR